MYKMKSLLLASDLDLAPKYLSNINFANCIIVTSNPHSKFGVNRSKQTQVIEQKLIYFRNSDLVLYHRHLGNYSKLPLDICYPHTTFGVNWPKQIQVMTRHQH